MALRFGNTTRLHHFDFPAASAESGMGKDIHSLGNDPVKQSEIMRPIETPGSLQKTEKINTRVRKSRQEKEINRKTRTDKSVQSLPPTQRKSEKLNNAGSCGLTHEDFSNNCSSVGLNAFSQQTGVCYMNLTVEWDVLDSFSEFAAFLEVQNPICPAHLIDTPEKLLSVLSCEF